MISGCICARVPADEEEDPGSVPGRGSGRRSLKIPSGFTCRGEFLVFTGHRVFQRLISLKFWKVFLSREAFVLLHCSVASHYCLTLLHCIIALLHGSIALDYCIALLHCLIIALLRCIMALHYCIALLHGIIASHYCQISLSLLESAATCPESTYLAFFVASPLADVNWLGEFVHLLAGFGGSTFLQDGAILEKILLAGEL